jgi:HEAT repeat protein
LERVGAELASTDWLVRGAAVHALFEIGADAAALLPAVFELTFDDKAPIRSHALLVIKRLGRHAVPFLIQQVRNINPDARARVIELLTESGNRWATTTRLELQVLDERRPGLPDWGDDSETVIELFEGALRDDHLQVRFAAACALEEFGRCVLQTVPVFVDALGSGTVHVQNWAALHLGRIGPDAHGACAALQAAVAAGDLYTSLAATNAFVQIGCAH